jgi:hypothetical protein
LNGGPETDKAGNAERPSTSKSKVVDGYEQNLKQKDSSRLVAFSESNTERDDSHRTGINVGAVILEADKAVSNA